MPARESEYNRVHQFYRARGEHVFGKCKKFAILSQRYMGEDSRPLQHAFVIVCSLLNIYNSVRMPYPPYSAK